MDKPDQLEQFAIARRADGTLWELGRGPIGITYKAVDTNLELPVALKVIHPRLFESEAARLHFLQATQVAGKFRHPNVAPILQAGNSEGRMFCVSEFIEGESVGKRVEREGALDPVVAVRIASQATRVLVAAERTELVHGDIKPSNIMLHFGLLAKIAEFGLTGCLKPVSNPEQQDVIERIFGTPYFLSPEQLEGRSPDVRSDIYALGATLWFIVTGRPLFHGSLANVIDQHLNRAIPVEVLARFPRRLVVLLEKMLVKRPKHRFQNASELKLELDQLLSELRQPDGTVPAATRERIAPEDASPIAFSAEQLLRNEYLVLRESPYQKDVYQAKEIQSDRIVALRPLSPRASYDLQWLNSFQEQIAKLQKVHHPNLVEVISLESYEHGFFIATEWVNGGVPLDKLLQLRSAFSWIEILPILEPLTRVLDFLEGQQLLQGPFSLSDIFVVVPDGTEESFQRAPVSIWPPFTVKLSPLGLAARSLEEFDHRLMAESACTAADSGLNQVQQFAILVYELLSGNQLRIDPKRFIPRFNRLPALSENGNMLLCVGALEPSRFTGANDFLQQLAGVESSARLPASTRSEAPVVLGEQSNAAAERETSVLPACPVTGLVGTKQSGALASEPLQDNFSEGESEATIRLPVRVPEELHDDPGKNSWLKRLRMRKTTIPPADQASDAEQAVAKPQPLSAPEPQPKQNLTQRRKDAKKRRDGTIFRKVNDSQRWHCKGRTLSSKLTRLIAMFVLCVAALFFSAVTLLRRPGISQSVSDAKATPSITASPTPASKLIASPTPMQQTGKLIVQSEPSGLSVEIVNQSQEIIRGITPVTLEKEPVGKYTVTIKRDGWPDHRQEVDLEQNGSVMIDHAFQEAKVMLKSDPPGAIVFKGQTELGKTPLTVSLPPGPVELVSRFGALEPVTQQITADPQNVAVMEFKHRYGVVSVESDRPDAEVFLAGNDQGEAPLEMVVPVGKQQIVVRVPGMDEQTQTADIQSGQHASLRFDFAAPTPTPTDETVAEPEHESSEDKPGSGTNKPKKKPVHLDHPKRQQPPVFQSRDDYNRARQTALSQFDQTWDTKKQNLKQRKDWLDYQISHSTGSDQEKWKYYLEKVKQDLSQYNGERRQAKTEMQELWKQREQNIKSP